MLVLENTAMAGELRFALSVRGCDSNADEIVSLVEVELHARSEDTANATRVAIACEGDEARIHIDDPLTAQKLDRTVSLAGVDASTRARTLAIAASELVSASWTTGPPEPAIPEPPPRSKVKPKPEAQPARPPLLVFEAVANARVFFESRELGLGGGLRFEPWITGSRWLLRFDLLADRAEGSRTLGAVAVETVSVGGAFGTGATFGAVRVAGTLGVRLGYGRIAGSSRRTDVMGTSLAGGWGGPEIELDVELFRDIAVHPVFAYTLGWAIGGVRSDVLGDRQVTAAGPFGAIAIGIAID